MALPMNCVINFDNPKMAYYAGQTVTGTAVYTFHKIKRVRGIFVRFKGAAETKWTSEKRQTRYDRHGKRRTITETVSHTGTEEYFNVPYYLQGGGSGDVLEFPPGTHTFPFKYELPMNLPTSHEGQYGRIGYTVEVVLDRPWKFNQEKKAVFSVVSHVDLNKIIDAKFPIEMHLKKSFFCLFGKSGPLAVDINLPSTGYVSGQTIPIEIMCKNDSSVTIETITFKLKQYLVYYCHTPDNSSKESKITVAKINTKEIPGHSTKNISAKLEIPGTTPSSLQSCGIIDLKYKLKVECIPSGMHLYLPGEYHIIIGTVPLVEFQSTVNGATNMTLPIVPPPVHVNSAEASYMRPYNAQPMFSPSLPPPYPAQTMPINSQVFPVQQMAYPPNMLPYPNSGMMNPVPLQPQYGSPTFAEGKYIPPKVDDSDPPPPYPGYGFAIPPK